MKCYGEIWLVKCDPSVGHEFQKIRPAIVVQSDDISSSLTTVMLLSSKIKKDMGTISLSLKTMTTSLCLIL